MALDDIVSVSITTATAQVSRASFGIPLVAGYHTHWVDLVRTYSASTAKATLVSEGFAVIDPIYLAVSAVLAANPRVKTIKVGRMATTWTQTIDLTPVSVNSTVYAGTLDGLAWTFTSDSSATLAEVCTGIASAIDALAGVTAVGSSGTKVVITSDAAAKNHTLVLTDKTNMYAFDSTANTGVVSDLTAIRAFDKDFYGLILDRSSRAGSLAAAGWAESEKLHLFVTNTELPSGTADLGYLLHAAAYARTTSEYNVDPNSFAGAAVAGAIMPFDPGSYTLAFKKLAGITVSTLSDTEITALKTRQVNYYTTQGGAPIVLNGVTASGEFTDIVIFIDWLAARIQERVFSLLVNTKKLPYSDESVDLVKSEILAVLRQGVQRGGLLAGGANGIPAPSVSAPLVADVDPLDRAARLLPDVTFSARLAGAIHAIEISGQLSV